MARVFDYDLKHPINAAYLPGGYVADLILIYEVSLFQFEKKINVFWYPSMARSLNCFLSEDALHDYMILYLLEGKTNLMPSPFFIHVL